MAQRLAAAVRAKYPGAYDDLSDAELEASVTAKYPGVYDDFETGGPAGTLPTATASATPDVPQGRSWMETARSVSDLGHQMNVVPGMVLGAVKGIGSSVVGATELATKIPGVSNVAETISQGLTGRPKAEVFDQARTALQPEGPAQSVGFHAEQLGEFLTPLGLGSKASAAVRTAPRLVRAGAKMAGEAVELGAKTAVQTGGDAEDVMTAALMGAASPGLVRAAKSVGKAVTQTFPERLYGQVFKAAYDDLRAAYQTAARNQPLNPTLAKEVLDRGVFGSSQNMAVYSLKKLDTLESQLQSQLTGKHVPLPQKADYIALLDTLKDEFGGAFAKMGKEAGALATKLRGSRGPVDAQDALTLKRLLDRARQTGSFRDSARLSPKQDDFKEAADLVRRTLHQQFPTASTLLNEERVFIQATEAIIKDAVQRSNRKLLGFTDYILGGGGMASGFGFSGVGAAAAVRGFQNPFTLTGIGKALNRLGLMTPSAERAVRAGVGVVSEGTR